MKRIKAGIIGCGHMGRNHISTILNNCRDEFEIVGICDPEEKEIKIAKNLFNNTPISCYSDYKEMLKDKGIQAVFISVPNFLHADVAIAALKAGKDVFCEKPIATKVEDVYRMLEAKEKTGHLLVIGFELRYAEFYQRMKELVEGECVGRPVIAWCKEFRGPFLPKVNNWIQYRDKSGGALVDKNSHHFDLMTWFLNARPLKVCAFGGTNVVRVVNTDDEVEDNACVIVEYEGGRRACLLLCMFSPETSDYGLELGIMGDRGRLETDKEQKALHFWMREKPEDIVWNLEERRPRYLRKSAHTVYNVSRLDVEGGHFGFLQEHKAFHRAIEKGEVPLTSIENVVYSTLIPIAAEESMRTGKVVEIK
ncbi:MAG: Gfo/Idh/MocA family oxidoreductase [bacterium]|nr:Gfo/Idh/MocA family oxidoreductase [bacterium]